MSYSFFVNETPFRSDLNGGDDRHKTPFWYLRIQVYGNKHFFSVVVGGVSQRFLLNRLQF